jgi:hypothetical protein
MSFDKLISKKSRLLSAIEVEVSSPDRPQETHIHGLHGLHDGDPLKALEELADKMDKLEAQAPTDSTNNVARDEPAKAIFEMQKQLERFQRQSAVLKRLINKLH